LFLWLGEAVGGSQSVAWRGPGVRCIVQRKRERPTEVILVEAQVIGDDSQSTAKS
jgi:hypothetical protein